MLVTAYFLQISTINEHFVSLYPVNISGDNLYVFSTVPVEHYRRLTLLTGIVFYAHLIHKILPISSAGF